MNLLEDDREQYAVGALVSKLVSKNFAKRNPKAAVSMYRGVDDKFGVTKDINELKNLSLDDSQKALDYFKAVKLSEKAEFKQRGRLDPSDADYYGEVERKRIFNEIDKKYEEVISLLKEKTKRVPKAVGGSLLQDDAVLLEEDLPIEETHTMPDGTVMPGATHGEGEMMTDEAPEEDMAPEEQVAPDGEMEEEYLDYILDTALSDEEEDMLMSRLEQDEELAMLFDKVIDVAQEFAGSGPVEGPGSGVSDSIPARLSDGEFVFTAAAVEEIGADNLMAMMKEAEMKAEERQGLAEGGELEERVVMPVEEQKEPQVRVVKETVDNTKSLLDEDEVSKNIRTNMMLDPNQQHVRS